MRLYFETLWLLWKTLRTDKFPANWQLTEITQKKKSVPFPCSTKQSEEGSGKPSHSQQPGTPPWRGLLDMVYSFDYSRKKLADLRIRGQPGLQSKFPSRLLQSEILFQTRKTTTNKPWWFSSTEQLMLLQRTLAGFPKPTQHVTASGLCQLAPPIN